ncbi:MAG: pyrroline-5-carboxylate reductase [Candidatus Bathyarchaeota archaeon]|nr:pyrroline-5-carboxylate reductase [Candidatus Bathyarchaeota archaeon]
MEDDDVRRIGVIGAGKMGEALLTGLIKSGIDEDLLRVSDISEERRRSVCEHLNVRCCEDNAGVVAESDIVILAVPPKAAPTVLRDLGDKLTPSHLVISIAAGVTTRRLFEGAGKRLKLIRVMPNNPCLIGEGMIVLAPTELVTDDDIAEAKRLFTSIGRVAVTAENHLDAVTGLSGSGPAYAYLVIEALADGGVKMGLPKGLSLTLAAQTLVGAARMVLEMGKHPAVLKDMVATPGGTTVQGLYVLEAAGVRSAFIKAVEEATMKSRNMMNGKS